MAQKIGSPPAGTVAELVDFVVGSIRKAPAVRTPFLYLLLRDFFPDDIYAAMVAAMPGPASYRGMSGRSKTARRPDGTPTRVKIDLFPEFIRHFPTGQRGIWRLVGRVLRCGAVQAAFADRLAADIERRFGAGAERLRCYPVPILTRDVPGYSIPPHTDTHWKAITVQICLPASPPSRMSAPCSTSGSRPASCAGPPRCRSRRTPAMPLPSASAPGIRPMWWAAR